MKSYKEKNKDQHVKTGFAILNDMLPLASPEFNPLENENQQMNNAPMQLGERSANQNEQMQENDSDQLPHYQPALLAQPTAPPEDYFGGQNINNAAQRTGMPLGFSSGNAINQEAVGNQAASYANPQYNEFQQ